MMLEKILRWGPAVLCAAAIFGLSSLPKLPEPPGLLGELTDEDKLNHLIAYFVLGLLTLRAVAWKQKTNLRAAAISFLLLIAFGATDEWHQSFVPGRRCDLLDWLSDATGAALGIGVLMLYNKRKKKEGHIKDEERQGL